MRHGLTMVGAVLAFVMLVGSAQAQSRLRREPGFVTVGAVAGAVVGGIGGAVAAGPIGGLGGAALGAGIGGTIGVLASGTERMLARVRPRLGHVAYASSPPQRPIARQRMASARLMRVRERTCIEGHSGARCVDSWY